MSALKWVPTLSLHLNFSNCFQPKKYLCFLTGDDSMQQEVQVDTEVLLFGGNQRRGRQGSGFVQDHGADMELVRGHAC